MPDSRRSSRIWRRIVWAVLGLAIFLPAISFGEPPAGPASVPCLPRFPDRDGWYGADGAYSIPLDSRRTLWLFGDTFVSGEEGRDNRSGMEVLLGNTLAVSTCTEAGGFEIRYVMRKKGGKILPFFGETEWLWPQDPFLARGSLYVPLLVIETDPLASGPLPFRVAGHRLARIRDFQDEDPLNWRVEYVDMSSAVPPGVISLATTSVVEGEHVYFFPLCVPTKNAPACFGNLLARLRLDRLDDPAQAVEYLAGDGVWRAGLNPADARIVLDAAVSEWSVRRHRAKKAWVAVYLSIQQRGNRLLYREAERMEGPWGAPKVLLSPIPEVDPNHPRHDPDTICYAGKEHIQFAGEGTLVVTYVCNSHSPDTPDSFLRKKMFLYRPVVEVLPYPP